MKRMRRQQRGIVAVVVAIAMLVLLLMAGFAIDIGHLALNKSRLQSTVDAAALAAAKVLDDTASEALATEAARNMFDLNAAEHEELSEVLSGADITVQFSSTLNPFAPGTSPPEYVRVIARNFSMWTSFTVLVGFDEMSTRASAVAGPSAPITNPCDVFPIGVCALPGSTKPYWGRVPYGLSGNTVTVLKLTSKDEPTIGTGNYQLLALVDAKGKSDLRRNLAAGAGCVNLGGSVLTETGNAATIRSAVNTRFDLYSSPFKGMRGVYPPDYVEIPNDLRHLPLDSDGTDVYSGGKKIADIGDVAYSYVNYLDDYDHKRYQNPPPPVPGGEGGSAERRIVTIPVIRASDCGATSGRKSVGVVGYATYLLLQPMCEPPFCASGKAGWIFGQFLGEGEVSGSPGPTGGFGPYKIVLHNDPDSPDS